MRDFLNQYIFRKDLNPLCSDVPDFTHTINLNIADVGATVHICTEINYVCTEINLYSQVISSDKSVHQILL